MGIRDGSKLTRRRVEEIFNEHGRIYVSKKQAQTIARLINQKISSLRVRAEIREDYDMELSESEQNKEPEQDIDVSLEHVDELIRLQSQETESAKTRYNRAEFLEISFGVSLALGFAAIITFMAMAAPNALQDAVMQICALGAVGYVFGIMTVKVAERAKENYSAAEAKLEALIKARKFLEDEDPTRKSETDQIYQERLDSVFMPGEQQERSEFRTENPEPLDLHTASVDEITQVVKKAGVGGKSSKIAREIKKQAAEKGFANAQELTVFLRQSALLGQSPKVLEIVAAFYFSKLPEPFEDWDNSLRTFLAGNGFGEKAYAIPAADLFIFRDAADDFLKQRLSLFARALGVAMDAQAIERLIRELQAKGWTRPADLSSFYPLDLTKAIQDLQYAENESEFKMRLQSAQEKIGSHLAGAQQKYLYPSMPRIHEADRFTEQQMKMAGEVIDRTLNAFNMTGRQDLKTSWLQITGPGSLGFIFEIIKRWAPAMGISLESSFTAQSGKSFFKMFADALQDPLKNTAFVLNFNGMTAYIGASNTDPRGKTRSQASLAGDLAHEYTEILLPYAGSVFDEKSPKSRNLSGDKIARAMEMIMAEWFAHDLGEDITKWHGPFGRMGETVYRWIYEEGRKMAREPGENWSRKIQAYPFPENTLNYDQGTILGGIARELGEKIAVSSQGRYNAYERAAAFIAVFAKEARTGSWDELSPIAEKFLNENKITEQSNVSTAVSPAKPSVETPAAVSAGKQERSAVRVERDYQELVRFYREILPRMPLTAQVQMLKEKSAYHETVPDWNGYQVEVIAGLHGAPVAAQEILKLSKDILAKPEEWVVFLEGLIDPARIEEHKHFKVQIDIQVLLKIVDILKAEGKTLPLINPLPNTFDKRLPPLVAQKLGISPEEVTAALYFQDLAYTFSSMASKGHSMRTAMALLMDKFSFLGYSPDEVKKAVIEQAGRLKTSAEQNAYGELIQKVTETVRHVRNEITSQVVREELEKYPGRKKVLALVGGNHGLIFGVPDRIKQLKSEASMGGENAEHFKQGVQIALWGLKESGLLDILAVETNALESPVFGRIEFSSESDLAAKLNQIAADPKYGFKSFYASTAPYPNQIFISYQIPGASPVFAQIDTRNLQGAASTLEQIFKRSELRSDLDIWRNAEGVVRLTGGRYKPGSLENESVALTNARGRFTGGSAAKNIAHQQGLWHATSHAYVFYQGKILLQLRSSEKKSSAGKLQVSVSGHLKPKETPEEGVLREGEEEIGIRMDPKKLRLVSRINQIKRSYEIEEGQNNEFTTVFAYDLDDEEFRQVSKKFNRTESDELLLVPISVFEQKAIDNPAALSGSLRYILNKGSDIYKSIKKTFGKERSELRSRKNGKRFLIEATKAALAGKWTQASDLFGRAKGAFQDSKGRIVQQKQERNTTSSEVSKMRFRYKESFVSQNGLSLMLKSRGLKEDDIRKILPVDIRDEIFAEIIDPAMGPHFMVLHNKSKDKLDLFELPKEGGVEKVPFLEYPGIQLLGLYLSQRKSLRLIVVSQVHEDGFAYQEVSLYKMDLDDPRPQILQERHFLGNTAPEKLFEVVDDEFLLIHDPDGNKPNYYSLESGSKLREDMMAKLPVSESQRSEMRMSFWEKIKQNKWNAVAFISVAVFFNQFIFQYWYGALDSFLTSHGIVLQYYIYAIFGGAVTSSLVGIIPFAKWIKWDLTEQKAQKEA